MSNINTKMINACFGIIVNTLKVIENILFVGNKMLFLMNMTFDGKDKGIER